MVDVDVAKQRLHRTQVPTVVDDSLIAPEVTAAMLVERTIEKKSFGNLILLLCKSCATGKPSNSHIHSFCSRNQLSLIEKPASQEG